MDEWKSDGKTDGRTVMRLSVTGREQQKNTNYAFRALLAVQLLSQVCGITATQLYEAIAVA